jgi:hypothetical protein
MTFALALLAAAAAPPSPVAPLLHAHAHNDYAHPRPLRDALSRGFASVEADVFLVRGQLLVGHDRSELRPERTLESLYLEPLRARAQERNGHIHSDKVPFYLLIDLKTEAKATYEALAPLLAKYADVLSTARDGRFERRAVTAVISGNTPREVIAGQKVRHAAIDGRPGDLDSDAPADLVPWVSASWPSQFKWRGDGVMPEAERGKLRAYVAKAHRRGRLVRFWATPEKPALWRELRAAGVDLVGTDRLEELQRFLLGEPRTK